MKAAHHLRNERGVALIYTAVIFGAVVAAVVVGVGVGRHAFIATEVQTVAEVAATEAAMAKLGGSTDAAATTAAQSVVAQNHVDGQTATIAGSDIVFGNFNAGVFTPGLPPENAAKATANATVSNLFAPLSIPGVFSIGQTAAVQKTATATFTGLGGGQPNLPLALCDCSFPSECFTNSCLPTYTTPTWTNTAAWTGFNLGHSDTNIQSFIPSACPHGGGGTPPELTADTSMIDVTNGAGSPPYDGVRCMVCQLGMCTDAAPCLVPVFACTCPLGPTNGQRSVVGFAEVVVDTFHCSGGGPNGSACPCGARTQGNVNGMSFHSVFRTNVTGPPGGGSFGVGFVTLVG